MRHAGRLVRRAYPWDGVHLPGVVRAPVGALDRYRRPLSVTALS
ncbi:hypothetical protein [uncultured Sphingomonas sp.]|nr:hypothetical protein [uncultured Sphingomonas sp.]